MEAAEWYKLRNDRTNRINKVILDSSAKTIKVIVNAPELLSNQVMALVMANTLSRWCRRVTFEVPKNTPCIIHNRPNRTLNELLCEIMVSADPYGDFHFHEEPCNDQYDFIIKIGNDNNHTNQDSYWIDSDGWIAGFGYGSRMNANKNRVNDNNPVGAVFAVSCLNAMIFSEYLGLAQGKSFQTWFSLFDFSQSINPNHLLNPTTDHLPDIGKVWQIGAGAVGSSFDFILSLMPVQGSIRIIDFDEASIPNTSSSQVFTAKDAFNSMKKVDACGSVFKGNNTLSVSRHILDYSSFINQGYLESDYPDCILCLANEKNVWSTIQNNEPPIVLHATTSSNWGINFGRHIPFNEWCIVCRFDIRGYKYTPICAKGVANTKEVQEEKLGILPYLSPVAGALVLAELLKLSQFKNNGYPINDNFIQLSMRNIQNSKFIGLQQKPVANCPVCINQKKHNYHEGYGNSKFCL